MLQPQIKKAQLFKEILELFCSATEAAICLRANGARRNFMSPNSTATQRAMLHCK